MRLARWVLILVLCARSASAADVGEVAAFEHDGSSYDDGTTGLPARQRIAKLFFGSHGDAYDFLIVFPTFPSSWGTIEGAGLHWTVRSDVDGIGAPRLDFGAAFGSPARLKGYIDVGSLRTGSPDGTVEAASAIIAHEVAHQWAARVRFRDLVTGQASGDLLGRGGVHWSFFLDSDAAVLYGSDWAPGPSGTFTATRSRERYSDLELYLMGLAPASQVQPMTLLRPAPATPFQPTDLPPPDGTVITATTKTVTIADIIAAEGPREPAYGAAPRLFRAAFVILTPAGQTATQQQVDFVEQVRRDWLRRFFFMTAGRAVMETELVDGLPATVSQHPGVRAGLDYLLAAQQADGAWRDASGTAVRDTEAAVEALIGFRQEAPVALALSRALTFLTSHTPASLDSEARRVRAILLVDPAHAGLDTTFSARRAAGTRGFGLDLGYAPTPFDTALAISARSLHGPLPSSDPDLQVLLSTASDGGGWTFTEGGPPRIEPSALTLQALRRVATTPADEDVAARGLRFLRGGRQENGGFADDGDSVTSTALAVDAIAAWNQLTPQEADGARSMLLARQESNGSWASSSHATARVVKALGATLLPNLSLTNVILSRSDVFPGETVLATVTVRNTGVAISTPTVVQAFSASGSLLSAAAPLAAIPAAQTTTVQLAVATGTLAGAAQIFFVVDPNSTGDESRRDDNQRVAALSVQPTPLEPELFVGAGSVRASPEAITRVPQSFVVTAEVANAGQQAAPNVAVSVIAGGVELGTTTVSLAGQFSQIVAIPITVAAAAGSFAYSVVVDPANAVSEPNEANNSVAAVLPVVPNVLVSLVSLSSPPSVEQGRDAALSILVRSEGTSSISNGRVEVQVFDVATGQLVETLAPLAVTAAAGQTPSLSAAWRARTPGDFRFEATLIVSGDGSAGDDHATALTTVTPSSLANLRVAVSDVTFAPSPALSEQPATVTAIVRNTGAASSPQFDAVLRDLSGPELQRSTLGPLAPGASAQLSATFTPHGTAAVRIAWEVDTASAVQEFDEDDNSVIASVTPIGIADLALGPADIRVTPSFARTDETASVSVTVRNSGGQPSAATDVALYENPPPGGRLIGTQPLTSLTGSASATVTFSWLTPPAPSTVRLVAIVNAAQSVSEQTFANNRAERAVVVQNNALALTEPFFSPNGDGIKDTTSIQYRLPAQGSIAVRVKTSAGQVVRQFAQASTLEGSLEWDGRDETGKVVRDGVYDVEVTSAGSTIGTLTAVLDTNRSSVVDAIGTAYLSTETLANGLAVITGELGLDDDFLHSGTPHLRQVISQWRAEDAVVYVAAARGGYESGDYQCALYAESIHSGTPRVISPTGWPCHHQVDTYAVPSEATYLPRDLPSFSLPIALEMSDDGRWVAMVRRIVTITPGFVPLPPLPQFPTVAGGTDTFAVELLDVRNGVVSQLATGPTSTHERVPISFSSDSTRFFPLMLLRQFPDEYREFGVDGSSRVISPLKPDNQPLTPPFPDHQYMLRSEGSVWVGSPTVLADPLDVGGAVLVPPGRIVNHHLTSTLCTASQPAPFIGRRIAELGADQYVFAGVDTTTCSSPPFSTCAGYYTGAGVSFGSCPVAVGPGLFRVGVGSQPQKVFAAPDITGRQFTTLATLASSPDGRHVAFGYTPAAARPASVWLLDLETGSARDLGTELGSQLVSDVQWSPGGSAITYMIREDTPRSVVTTANLATVIAGFRKPGGQALVLRGTAQDLNFEQYELAARPFGSTVAPVSIGGGTAPVVKGTLGEWLPLQAGLYEVFLTTHDKAGNTREARATVGWSAVHALVSLAADPVYLSPNGDGSRDTTSLRYRTTVPYSTLISIKSSQGNPIHDFPRTHPSAGEFSLTWDGRDQAGHVVPDGRYTVQAETLTQDVTVDTVAPVPSLSAPAQPFVYVDAPAVDSSQQPRTYVNVLARRSHQAVDPLLERWTVETAPADAPTAFVARETGTEATLVQEQVPLDAVRGQLFRLRATDLAGNSAVTSTVTYPERLFLTALGDASLIDASAGMLTTPDGRQLPRLDRLDRAVDSAGNPVTFGFAPRRYALALATSVGPALVNYAVAYRPSGSTGPFFVDSANVEQRSETLIVWDARAVPGMALDAEVRATDATGRVFSVPVRFSRVERSGLLSACAQTTSDANAALELTLVSGEPTPEIGGGSYVDLVPAGGAAVERSWPIRAGGPVTTQAGRATYPVESASIAGLASCAYTLNVRGTLASGPVIVASTTLDICGLRGAGGAASDGRISIALAESFIGAPTGVDTFVRPATGGPWQLIESAAGFSETRLQTLDVSAFPQCGTFEIRWVSHFAASTDSDTLITSRAECAPLRTIAIPCTRASVAVAAPPLSEHCQPQSAPAIATLTAATTAGATLVSMSAWLQAPASLPILSLPVLDFVPGGSTATAHAEVPLYSIPSGPYVVGVEVVDSIGNRVRATGPASPLVADSQPPAVFLNSPGTVICSQTSTGGDGSTRRGFTASGFVSDELLTEYSVVVGQTSRLTHVFPSPAPRTISGSLGFVDLTQSGGGDLEVRLAARDVSGGSYCSAAESVHVEAGVELDDLEVVSPARTISTATFRVNEPGAATVSLETLAGSVVATLFSASVPAGTVSAPLNLAGRADGQYRLRARITTGLCANEASAAARLDIDTTGPLVRIDAPAAGATVSGSVQVSGAVADDHFASYVLEVGEGAAPTGFSAIASSAAPLTGVLGTFDTTGRAPGPYVLRLRAQDTAGNSSETTRSFLVAAPTLLSSFSLVETAVSPNGDGRQDDSSAIGNLLAPATLTVELLDPSGAVIAAPRAAAAAPAGPFTVALPQPLLASLADGILTVRATASSGSATDAELAAGDRPRRPRRDVHSAGRRLRALEHRGRRLDRRRHELVDRSHGAGRG